MLGIARWLWERLFLRLQIFLATLGVLSLLLVGVTWREQRLAEEAGRLNASLVARQLMLERASGLIEGGKASAAALSSTLEPWRAHLSTQDRPLFVALERALASEPAAVPAALTALGTLYAEQVISLRETGDQRRFLTMVLANGVLGLIALMTLGGWAWTAHYMSRPFNAISRALGRINAGETDFPVAYQQRVDEVGVISRSIEAFRQMLKERNAAARALALEHEAKAQSHARIEAAIACFEQAAAARVDALSQTSQALNLAASTLSAGADETACQADLVAEASSEMHHDTDLLVEAGGQLVASIGEIAQRMERASQVSQSAHGLSVEMAGKFRNLEEVVSAIGHVVDLINDIAGQTNLLALNATIEAARAGEAGKGFAVVAQEVKQLAAQTTRATAEISDNVNRVRAVTDESMASVAGIGVTIEDMRAIAVEVSAAVEQQRAATEQIAGNVRSAAGRSESVSENIAGVAAAAQQTGAASLQVLNSAERLSEASASIKSEIEQFLETIRAA